MATKAPENPIVRQKIAAWSEFVRKYTGKGLSTVHDEASWYAWKRQMKELYGEDISDKYYLEYRPTFEEYGGYRDDFGKEDEQEKTHESPPHGSGGSHIGSSHHSSSSLPSTGADEPQDEQPLDSSDSKDTAEGADRFVRGKTSQTPTADAAQTFLNQQQKNPPLPEETPAQIREREKKDAARKIIKRFFQENPVNYRKALVDKYLPSDPRFQASLTEQREGEIADASHQGELGDTRADTSAARKQFLAYHKDAVNEYYKKERAQRYEKKEEDPMWQASLSAATTTQARLAEPENNYYQPFVSLLGEEQVQEIGEEAYAEDYAEFFPENAERYAATGDEEMEEAVQTSRLESMNEATEADEEQGSEGSQEAPQSGMGRLPSLPFRRAQPQPKEEEKKEEGEEKDKTHSHTRDEKQEKAAGNTNKRSSLKNKVQNNPFTKGKQAVKNKLNQGKQVAKDAAKNAAKQAAKKVLKEGAKQLAEKGLAATAEYWVPVVVIILLILLLIIFILVLLGAAGQVAQQPNILPVTVTKTVDKTEIKNPSELTDAERLLTYTITAGYGGEASGLITTDPVPAGTTVASVSGNPTFYDESGQLTNDISRARKVVWTEGGTPTGDTAQNGKGAVGASQVTPGAASPAPSTDNTTPTTSGTINNLGFGPSDATRIETMIKKLSPSSPMINQGQTIIDRAREFNIDPLMIIVTRNESQFCSDNGVVSPGGSDPDNYDCGGIIWDAAQITDTTRWHAAPGPSANGHVFAFVPTIQDGIGLFFNYIAASKFYNGKTLQQFYDIYNPCSDPGNGGKFACGASEANNMLQILQENAGPASDGSNAFTGTASGGTTQKIGTKTYTITLSVNKDTKDTYIINQASSEVVGAATTTTTTTTTNVAADKPAGWPTNGLLTQGPHGALDHDRIFNETGGYEAVDIADGGRPPLYATFDGKVKEVHDCQKEGDCSHGYWGVGNSVILSDEKETFSILYGHMARIDVAAGSQVKRGDKIGVMGTTGVSTGIHLHWEFRGIKLAPPYIPQAITPSNCDPDSGIPCTPGSVQYTQIEAKSSSSQYWLLLHRRSKKEDLYQGTPGDSENSSLVKEYMVNTGVSAKSPTPLPRLAGREYWTITKKQTNTLTQDKATLGPYFLVLDIPYATTYNGPENYKECSYTTTNEQCQWPTPGAFGLQGVGDTPSHLTDQGSTGTIEHSDADITDLYNLLSPAGSEIRYYILDD